MNTTPNSQKCFSLSIVIPMLNEERSLDMLFDRLLPIVKNITTEYEIICVDDGSTDGTVEQLRKIHAEEKRVKMVRLSRNFGKEIALAAGLDHANGDAVVPLDADLQDPPELISRLVEAWIESSANVVLAKRAERATDTKFKRSTAGLFYRLINIIGDLRIPENVGDFRLMDRQVVAAYRMLHEHNRFNKGLFAWLGFKSETITYSRPARAAGQTNLGFIKLLKLALDGIFSFSTFPLRIWSYLGASISFLATCYAVYIIARILIVGVDVPGYASLVTMALFFGGMILTGLGIIGEYIGRIFLEVKRRPLYLCTEFLGLDQEE